LHGKLAGNRFKDELCLILIERLISEFHFQISRIIAIDVGFNVFIKVMFV
jgi:hypothetical protein